MKPPTTTPTVTPQIFETLYYANLAAPDQPSAETAYRRTEAAFFIQTGQRVYASYNSFKSNLSQRRNRPSPPNGGAGGGCAEADKKQTLTVVMMTVNTYLCTIDLNFLQRYHADLAAQAQRMEVFGPMNGTYDPAQLQTLKTTATALQHLIEYIKTAVK